MSDDSAKAGEPPPKEPAKKEADAEKPEASKKSEPHPIKNPVPKPRNRSPTPQLDTDSDDPEGDAVRTSSKEPSKRSASLEKSSAKPEEKIPEQQKTVEGKPSTSARITSPLRPPPTTTPRGARAPSATTTPSYGVPGVVRVKQTTVTAQVRNSADLYKKYPWLKPSMPSARPPSQASPTKTTPEAPKRAVSQESRAPPAASSGTPAAAGKPDVPSGTPAAPSGKPALPSGTPRTPSLPPLGRSPHRPPPASFRDLAKPFAVQKLTTGAPGGPPRSTTPASKTPAAPPKITTPAMSILKNMSIWQTKEKKEEKPVDPRTSHERFLARRRELDVLADLEKEEDEHRPTVPRPPPTTVIPMAARKKKTFVSEDLLKRFMDSASHNQAQWRDARTAEFKPRPPLPPPEAAQKMLDEMMRPMKEDRTKPRGRPPGSTSARAPQHDPFAPPTEKKPKVKRDRSSKKKSLEATSAGEAEKEGGSPQKQRPEGAEGNDPVDHGGAPDFHDDSGAGGGGASDGDEAAAAAASVEDDGETARASSSIVDVGSPAKAPMRVKQEGEKETPPLPGSIKIKKEQEMDARRKELLKPSLHKLYLDEMTDLAKDKEKFERELMEKMSKEKPRLPALPTVSQLMKIKNKPSELKEAMSRLVGSMKSIGSADPQGGEKQPGALTKHMNQMMDTMTKEVFLGAVRHEVYDAQDNMFEEAVGTYMGKSAMMKLTEEDYERGRLAVRVARQEKERQRARREHMRELQQSKKAAKLVVYPAPKKLGKRALSKLTEEQRRRRFLPPPRTPPGSPSEDEERSPPVSTAGSRIPSPERLPAPITPPGSPPPPAKTNTKAAREAAALLRLQVQLDDSFEMEFGEGGGGGGEGNEGEEGEEALFAKREKHRADLLKKRKAAYDAAVSRYSQSVERGDQRSRPALPQPYSRQRPGHAHAASLSPAKHKYMAWMDQPAPDTIRKMKSLLHQSRRVDEQDLQQPDPRGRPAMTVSDLVKQNWDDPLKQSQKFTYFATPRRDLSGASSSSRAPLFPKDDAMEGGGDDFNDDFGGGGGFDDWADDGPAAGAGSDQETEKSPSKWRPAVLKKKRTREEMESEGEEKAKSLNRAARYKLAMEELREREHDRSGGGDDERARARMRASRQAAIREAERATGYRGYGTHPAIAKMVEDRRKMEEEGRRPLSEVEMRWRMEEVRILIERMGPLKARTDLFPNEKEQLMSGIVKKCCELLVSMEGSLQVEARNAALPPPHTLPMERALQHQLQLQPGAPLVLDAEEDEEDVVLKSKRAHKPTLVPAAAAAATSAADAVDEDAAPPTLTPAAAADEEETADASIATAAGKEKEQTPLPLGDTVVAADCESSTVAAEEGAEKCSKEPPEKSDAAEESTVASSSATAGAPPDATQVLEDTAAEESTEKEKSTVASPVDASKKGAELSTVVASSSAIATPAAVKKDTAHVLEKARDALSTALHKSAAAGGGGEKEKSAAGEGAGPERRGGARARPSTSLLKMVVPQQITRRLSQLWRASEGAPKHVRDLMRRAMPTQDGRKAEAVLYVREQIAAAEKTLRELHAGSYSQPFSGEKKLLTGGASLRNGDEFVRLQRELETRPVKPADYAPAPMESDEESERQRLREEDRVLGLERKEERKEQARRRAEDKLDFDVRARAEKMRRDEIVERAMKRQEEERKRAARMHKKRMEQQVFFGGVVVGLKAGEKLRGKKDAPPSVAKPAAAEAAAAVPAASAAAAASPAAASGRKKTVLVRKFLTAEQRETALLKAFYAQWNGQSAERREAAEQVTKQAAAAAPKPPGGKKVVEENLIELDDIDEEEDEERRREKGKEKEGDAPGGSKVSAPAAAAAKKPLPMKYPDEMDPHVKVAYRRWKLDRKHTSSVLLNTGVLVDEVELAEMAVPEGMEERHCVDTRPFQRDRSPFVLEEPLPLSKEAQEQHDLTKSKSGVIWRKVGAQQKPQPQQPGGGGVDVEELQQRLRRKKSIIQKRLRGEQLEPEEADFVDNFYKTAEKVLAKRGGAKASPGEQRTAALIARQNAVARDPLRATRGGGVEKGSRSAAGVGGVRQMAGIVPGGGGGVKKRLLLTRLPTSTPLLQQPQKVVWRPIGVTPSKLKERDEVRECVDALLDEVCGEGEGRRQKRREQEGSEEVGKAQLLRIYPISQRARAQALGQLHKNKQRQIIVVVNKKDGDQNYASGSSSSASGARAASMLTVDVRAVLDGILHIVCTLDARERERAAAGAPPVRKQDWLQGTLTAKELLARLPSLAKPTKRKSLVVPPPLSLFRPAVTPRAPIGTSSAPAAIREADVPRAVIDDLLRRVCGDVAAPAAPALAPFKCVHLSARGELTVLRKSAKGAADAVTPTTPRLGQVRSRILARALAPAPPPKPPATVVKIEDDEDEDEIITVPRQVPTPPPAVSGTATAKILKRIIMVPKRQETPQGQKRESLANLRPLTRFRPVGSLPRAPAAAVREEDVPRAVMDDLLRRVCGDGDGDVTDGGGGGGETDFDEYASYVRASDTEEERADREKEMGKKSGRKARAESPCAKPRQRQRRKIMHWNPKLVNGADAIPAGSSVNRPLSLEECLRLIRAEEAQQRANPSVDDPDKCLMYRQRVRESAQAKQAAVIEAEMQDAVALAQKRTEARAILRASGGSGGAMDAAVAAAAKSAAAVAAAAARAAAAIREPPSKRRRADETSLSKDERRAAQARKAANADGPLECVDLSSGEDAEWTPGKSSRPERGERRKGQEAQGEAKSASKPRYEKTPLEQRSLVRRREAIETGCASSTSRAGGVQGGEETELTMPKLKRMIDEAATRSGKPLPSSYPLPMRSKITQVPGQLRLAPDDDSKLGWKDCLTLLHSEEEVLASARMGEMRKIFDEIETKSKPQLAEARRREEAERRLKGREDGAGSSATGKGRLPAVLQRSKGKKLVLRRSEGGGEKPGAAVPEGKRKIVLRRKEEGGGLEVKKRFFVSRSGKRVLLKPRGGSILPPLKEMRRAPAKKVILTPSAATARVGGASAGMLDMPKLTKGGEEEEEEGESTLPPADDSCPPQLDDGMDASGKQQQQRAKEDEREQKSRKRRAREEDEQRRRRDEEAEEEDAHWDDHGGGGFDHDDDDGNQDVLIVPTTATSQVKEREAEKKEGEGESKRVAMKRREEEERKAGEDSSPSKSSSSPPKKRFRIIRKILVKSPAKAPEDPKIAEKMIEDAKAAAQAEADKVMKKNEAAIRRQEQQLQMQKKLLADIRAEMMTTFENADRTNKLVEQTRTAMIGECEDFAEYRKVVEARELLMNTMYEQAVDQMKAQVATEESKARAFASYKKKAVKREKALIKEVEHTKAALDKIQSDQIAAGLPKKGLVCVIPITKATKRARDNRFKYVMEAVKRVWGEGVEGDFELEKEQVKAVVKDMSSKYGMERQMNVEQDREFCHKHEIGYRQRILMKKHLAELELDVFCSQRQFDKVRRELDELDGTEEMEREERPVKREKRERRMTKKQQEIARKKMMDPREISLGRDDGEGSDVDIEEIMIDDDDYTPVVRGGLTDGGETSGAERERANRRYNMARFAGTRLLTSDEEYIEESDLDQQQPGPSNRYIPVPAGYASGAAASTSRMPQLQQAQQPQSHYLHGAPILQPMQQQSQQHHNARRGRGGARVRGGKH